MMASPAPDGSEGAPQEPGFQAAAGAFASALVRFAQALAGLFGLELRETGAQILLLASLAVALVVAAVLSYLFLLLGLAVLASAWFGGGWPAVLLGLCLFHLLLAAVIGLVLRRRAERPLFPATREALRREADRLS